MTAHLNELNKKLQGKGNTAQLLLKAVLSFEHKLTVFARDTEKGTPSHVPAPSLLLWVSKFKSLRTEFEDIARQEATIAQTHQWRDIEKLLKQDQLVFQNWNSSIRDNYDNMKRYTFGVLSILGSTYLCEQVFSSMNYIKSKLRSRLTDESLKSCLKIKATSYSPDMEKICSEVQKQKSQ
ncbi:hypothetical protein SKAU_G00315460 [Synaphobranchus kaupii]|uniref:HAT C-terminal dimerisation domain-containing protein n=1 Tax=Synaphobranchus kaupii TaxID=118154 RepID=A0A9Q1ILN5_SYNKA|nr:hypothetical protein SKAU_G00315460 [Synaphobranchus kaupii]